MALLTLTRTLHVVTRNNMKAMLLQRSRTNVGGNAFIEMVVWRVPSPVPGSSHPYKYRLALVIDGECVLRYDNERGKGDHRHMQGREEPVEFESLVALLGAFETDAERILK